jgi:GTPase SAR1 family protein
MESNKPNKQDYFIKLLLLGDVSVGKSSLIGSYNDGEFPKNLVFTMGMDYKTKHIKL